MSIEEKLKNDSNPSGVIFPNVDTDADVLADKSLETIVPMIPPAVVGVIALVLFLGGNELIAGLVASVFAALLALAVYAIITSAWYAPPRERITDLAGYLWSQRKFPMETDETAGYANVDAVHGVIDVHENAIVECTGGRYAMVIPINGTNGDQLDAETTESLVSQLTKGVDEDMKNQWWAFYSTSQDGSSEDVARHWESQAVNEEDHETNRSPAEREVQTSLQKEVLFDAAEWLRDDDEDWDANEWNDYVEVQVFPHEYDIVDHKTEDSALDALTDRISSVTGGFEAGVDDTGAQTTPEDVLEDRYRRVRDMISNIDGVDHREPDQTETADLLIKRWTNGTHVTGDDLAERLETSVTDEEWYEGPTTLQKLAAPDTFDAHGTTLKLDDGYARTFWISEWPVEPEEMFLRDIYTLDEIDLDVRIIGQPASKERVVDNLEVDVAEVWGEESKREKEQHAGLLSIQGDVSVYEKGYIQLQGTNTQPWRLSGYITVKADTIRELANDAERVTKLLEAYPAKCLPVASGTKQKDLFTSGSPCAPDIYARESPTQKSPIALGGAYGAAFPFIRSKIHEPEGIRWGRNTQTGLMHCVDPFQRGSAPHLITVGKSRSGKTYGVSQAVAEWYLAEDDRTLIVLDTQGGFDGLTKLCQGDHIIIDGKQGVNPFYIRPPPEGEVSTGEMRNSYGMKVAEVTEFIAGILRIQNVDPSDYMPTITSGVQAVYDEYGITPRNIPEDPEFPTLRDWLETIHEMAQDASDYTHFGEETETAAREQYAGELLEKLTALKEDVGQFSHLLDERDPGITPDTDMAYLDLRQFQNSTDAEKSIHHHLMHSQVSQLIKETDGETIFVIDEAHLLLHSEKMLEYLQSAAREWARYDAAMWFVSQSPQDFIRRSSETDKDQESHRQTIVEQCSTVQVYYTGDQVNAQTLRDMGLPDSLIPTAKKHLTRGKAGKGYSECLIHFGDEQGWFRDWVEAPPVLDAVLNYRWHDDRTEDFVTFLRRTCGDDVARLAQESLDEAAQAETDRRIAQAEDTAEKRKEAAQEQIATPATDGGYELTVLHQVGPARAETLREAGFETVRDIAEADHDDLAEAVGPQRGEAIKNSAVGLLVTPESESEPEPEPETA